MASASSCLSLLVVAVLASAAGAQNLSPPTFYDTTCPRALATIKSAVDSAVAQEPRMGASLLNQRGLLHSDQELFNGGASTDSNFSSNATAFSSAFATAMAKTGSLGQIRVLCSRGNAS